MEVTQGLRESLTVNNGVKGSKLGEKISLSTGLWDSQNLICLGCIDVPWKKE